MSVELSLETVHSHNLDSFRLVQIWISKFTELD